MWPARENFVPRKLNVKKAPLAKPKMVLLPPLHLKLKSVKNFVKSFEKKKVKITLTCG
jgi:hypothetical protein